MAYGYSRRRRRSTRYTPRYSRSRYSRSGYSRRRRAPARRRRTGAQRIIIQVVGGPSGVATSPISIGMKSARPVRRRF